MWHGPKYPAHREDVDISHHVPWSLSLPDVAPSTKRAIVTARLLGGTAASSLEGVEYPEEAIVLRAKGLFAVQCSCCPVFW
jgi:hypothetical protein